jgi:2-keto-4-pentenoate hydratase
MLTDDELARLAREHQQAMTEGEIWARFVDPSPDMTLEEARSIVTNLIYDDLRDERDGKEDDDA